MKLKLTIIFISLFLVSCSILSPVKTSDMKEYVVNKIPNTYAKKHRTDATLQVARPVSNSVYDLREMAYSTSAHKINYFAKNRWAATPASMLHPLIQESLQKTNYFKAVAPTKGLGSYRYTLNTQILEFKQIFYGDKKSAFKLKVRAQLIQTATSKVISSREFNITETAPSCDPYGGVVAANKATEVMLGKLSAWVVGNL